MFWNQLPVLPEDDILWDIQEAGQARSERRAQYHEVSAYHPAGRAFDLNCWSFGDFNGVGAGAGELSHPDGRIVRTPEDPRKDYPEPGKPSRRVKNCCP